MTFNDIFKSSFLEDVSAFQPLDMIIALALSLVLGLFIFMVYKRTFNGVMYSQVFGLSLIAMCMITTLVILAISSNVVLSLGMVGALSIVRFRTAVKDPMDIVYLFWSIASGIVLGAGMLPLAMLGTAFVGIVLIALGVKKVKDSPYILIVECDDERAEEAAAAKVREAVKKYTVKSKTVSKSGIEMTMEVRLPEMSTEFVNAVTKIDGVKNAALVSYNGEYLS